MSKVIDVANMMADRPQTVVKDVMKKFKVSKTYAYNLMSQARKLYINRREEALAKPKLRMQTADAPAVDAVSELIHAMTKDGLSAMRNEASTAADPVNHPFHYVVGGIETIDFIEAKKLNYHLGNVVKYIARSDYKGDRLENLKKAHWYLTREIEKASK